MLHTHAKFHGFKLSGSSKTDELNRDAQHVDGENLTNSLQYLENGAKYDVGLSLYDALIRSRIRAFMVPNLVTLNRVMVCYGVFSLKTVGFGLYHANLAAARHLLSAKNVASRL